LWSIAVGSALCLAYFRWRSSSGTIGGDFDYTLAAAREIAVGRSPYSIKQFVYPPPMALIIVPFAHASAMTIWKIWLAVIVGAPFIGIVAFTSIITGPKSWWLRPIAFALCSFTVFYSGYYPLSRDLVLGQTDTILFSVIIIGALAAASESSRTRGIAIGVAGLIKVWPWCIAVAIVQPHTPRRRQILFGVLAIAALAPLSAAIFGWSGIIGFVRNVLDAHLQRVVSDSVWGIPQLLFLHTGLANPVVTSTPLAIVLTALLVVWVVTLLVVTLRASCDGALGTWNVYFCVILLLPISHRQYAICVLPLLWWWMTFAIMGSLKDWRLLAIVGILLLWWVNQTVQWPYTSSPSTISALRYCVPFIGDLLACSASVCGARLFDTTGHLPSRAAVARSWRDTWRCDARAPTEIPPSRAGSATDRPSFGWVSTRWRAMPTGEPPGQVVCPET
jgi:hypothetical protein